MIHQISVRPFGKEPRYNLIFVLPPIVPKGGRQTTTVTVIISSSTEGTRCHIDEDIICVAKDSRLPFFGESRTTSPSAAFAKSQQF